jgi:hypothetical protein
VAVGRDRQTPAGMLVATGAGAVGSRISRCLQAKIRSLAVKVRVCSDHSGKAIAGGSGLAACRRQPRWHLVAAPAFQSGPEGKGQSLTLTGRLPWSVRPVTVACARLPGPRSRERGASVPSQIGRLPLEGSDVSHQANRVSDSDHVALRTESVGECRSVSDLRVAPLGARTMDIQQVTAS